MRALGHLAATAVAVTVLAGCGDRLVDGRYRGPVLASIQGSLVPTPETRLAIAGTRSGSRTTPPPARRCRRPS